MTPLEKMDQYIIKANCHLSVRYSDPEQDAD